MADIIPYSSATELAQLYHQTIGEVLQLIAAADEKLSTLNDKFGNIGSVRPFDWDFKIHGTDKPDKIRREMKRNAWRVLISKLGVERLMSPKRRDELREAFYGRHLGDDPIDKFPEISAEAIFEVMAGFAASADEFLDESIQDVYQWLKPRRGDEYKTNVKNRWRLSRKVILSWMVERGWNGEFRTRHSGGADRLQALDNIMHLLDGHGIPETHYGPLKGAINTSGKDGTGETEYFKFRCFKNGNLHLEFKRADLVDEFNLRCGNRTQLPGSDEGRYEQRGNGGNRPENQPPVAPNGDLNFFETPEWKCREMAGAVSHGDLVLEPSAGEGAIAHAARSSGGIVLCVELDLHRCATLRSAGFDAIQANFLEMPVNPKFDAVLMNPPFSHKRDIAHIRHAWEFVKPGGNLVAIASSGVLYRSDEKTLQFREWLSEIGAEVEEDGSIFEESGTGVNTITIRAVKEDAAVGMLVGGDVFAGEQGGGES